MFIMRPNDSIDLLGITYILGEIGPQTCHDQERVGYRICFSRRGGPCVCVSEMLLPRSLAASAPVLLSAVAVLFLFGFLMSSSILWPVFPQSQPVYESDAYQCGISGEPGVLQEHIYRQDGLLEVNEKGPHPIYELTARAEVAWEQKLKAASKTLPEAVNEYRRRYGRSPPLGFDLW